MLTASGDGTVHIWQCAVHLHNESSSGRMASSDDELDPFEADGGKTSSMEECSVLRTPLRSLTGTLCFTHTCMMNRHLNHD